MQNRNPKSSKTALITGGAIRLGRVIALKAASLGFDIAIHYHGSKKAAELLADDIQSLGQRAIPIQADLCDPKATEALFETACAKLGGVQLLVNNASMFETDTSHEFSPDVWKPSLALHAEAPARLTSAMAKQLGKSIDAGSQPQAQIINIIDQRVFNLRPGFLSYSIAKSALWTLTQLAAIELAPHIRVNAIAPGLTMEPEPNPGRDFADLASELTLSQQPTDPDELAHALDFLIHSASVTGQALILDGGQHLGWRVLSKPS